MITYVIWQAWALKAFRVLPRIEYIFREWQCSVSELSKWKQLRKRSLKHIGVAFFTMFLEDSVLLEDTMLSEDRMLPEHTVLLEDTVLLEGTMLLEDSVLPEDTVVPEGVLVSKGDHSKSLDS